MASMWSNSPEGAYRGGGIPEFRAVRRLALL
jgi:hypothetical protein